MFNTSFIKLKLVLLLVFSLSFSACKKDEPLKISNYEYLNEDTSYIEVNIPKIDGDNAINTKINKQLQDFVCASFNINSSEDIQKNIEDCAEQFNKGYLNFKKQLNANLFGELPNWEVIVDGELSYQNESLICFAMSSTLNTGGVNPVTKIAFYNFDKSNGKLLKINDLVNDIPAFKNVLEGYFARELNATYFKIDRFKDETDQLKNPEYLGYNDSGIIAIYKTPNNSFVECLVPFFKVQDFLNY